MWEDLPKPDGEIPRFSRGPCVLDTPCFQPQLPLLGGTEVGRVMSELWESAKLGRQEEEERFPSEHGFWVISMKAGTICTCSVPERKSNSLQASPSLVGIFLDIELEEVNSFDVNHDALIYINSNISCLEPLGQFSCPELPVEGGNAALLTICPSENSSFLDSSSKDE